MSNANEIGFVQHKAQSSIRMSVPVVSIKPEAFYKMLFYVRNTKGEVGWIGHCTKPSRNEIIIHDVYLPRQQAHEATCELSPSGLADIAQEILLSDFEKGDEICNNLRLWGHSHGISGVSPSSQDIIQLQEFEETGYEWFLGVIANQSGSLRFTYIDFENLYTIEDLPWKLYFEIPDGLEDYIISEVKDKVSPILPKKSSKGNKYYVTTQAPDGISILFRPEFANLEMDDLLEIANMKWSDGCQSIIEECCVAQNTASQLWMWCFGNKKLFDEYLSVDEMIKVEMEKVRNEEEAFDDYGF